MKLRLADNISLVAQTPGLDCETVEIAITIPTFKRPNHLLRTLGSIAKQRTSRKTAIVLIENEAELREGAEVAGPLFEDGTYKGIVIVAHDRGNCHAYNAGWSIALQKFPNLKYLAVIDDDEIAEPQWLEELCSTSEQNDAALVGGPQIPVFDEVVREKWKTHPVFTPHYTQTGLVEIIYSSGNLLVRHDVLQTMPQPFFDLAFNFTGGGDSDLIHRSRRQGFRIAWCNEARIFETVPSRRVTWDWIQKRSLRNGQLSALIAHREANGSLLSNFYVVAHSMALLIASPFRALLLFAKSGSLLSALYPVHIALGRLASEFGYSNEQYRNPEQN